MDCNNLSVSLTRRILSCVCAGLFFFYTIFQKVTFNAISGDLISHFHLSTTGLGAVSSAYLYANALWLIPGGILLERFSARTVTLLFVFACACTSFVFAVSPSILLDTVMRFIGGLGSAMSLLISLRMAARWFPKHSARATGLLISLGMSAGFFANAPFLHLIQIVGWQNSLILTGYFGLAITGFMLLFLHDKKDTEEKSPFQFASLAHDMKRVLKNNENWKSGFFIGLMNLPIFILASLWGNLYLMHTANYSNAQAAFIISMIFIGEISGAPVIGWISDKLQRRKLVMIVGAVLSLSVALLLLDVRAFSVFELTLLFFLLGFFLSAQCIGYSVIAECNDASVISTASGFGSFIVNMLGAVCQVLFPVLLTFNTLNGVAGAAAYKTAYLMFPIAFLISILIANRMKETLVGNIKLTAYTVDDKIAEEKLLSHS